MGSVTVPGDVLEDRKIYGLKVSQIIFTITVPAVLLLVISIYLPFIRNWMAFGLFGIGLLFGTIVLAMAPKGQDPIPWFISWIQRKLYSKRRYAVPRRSRQVDDPLPVQDVVYTVDQIRTEYQTTIDKETVDRMVQNINYAEDIDRPEWATENANGLLAKIRTRLR